MSGYQFDRQFRNRSHGLGRTTKPVRLGAVQARLLEAMVNRGRPLTSLELVEALDWRAGQVHLGLKLSSLADRGWAQWSSRLGCDRQWRITDQGRRVLARHQEGNR